MVFKRHYAQVSSIKLRHRTPETVTVVFLGLRFDRIFYDGNQPLPLEIRAFPYNLVLEIRSVPVIFHHYTRSMRKKVSVSLTTRTCSPRNSSKSNTHP